MVLSFCGVFFNANAQVLCFNSEQNDILLPDSLIVIPTTLSIHNRNSEPMEFQFDKVSGYLRIVSPDSIPYYEICYSYINKKGVLVRAPISSYLYDSTVLFKNQAELFSHGKSTEELLGLSGLNIDGAFLRSVSAGQQQSVFMHSVMDLSISGNISDDLKLEARLTDQQMPFEPEGNTQRLQDFDRVNVKLIHDNWALQGGDMLVQSDASSKFLRYNRQVQGVGVSTSKLALDSAVSHTEAIASFSRSKTGIQLIEPIEGVLGPYRIRGPQNEPFIFLLAGSESVYLDGVLLTRGIEHDYIIDYNAAEITFNATVYINKFSRIQIEFEYSDQQYARNVSIFKHQQTTDRLTLRAGMFQEADQPNRALYDLSQDDMNALAQLDASAAVGHIPAVDSIGFQANKILYAKKDTLINDQIYSSFYYSKDPEKAFYQVYFSLVGNNKGNYVVANSMENAIVYEWIAPIDGMPQGNYAPLKQVALPKKQRVFSIGADYKLSNNDVISFDFAASEKIDNRFNPEGSKNNGKALYFGYKSSPKPLNIGNNMKFQYQLTYEYLDSAFIPVQVFRSMEFNRDWGMEQGGSYMAGEEHLLGFGSKIYNENQSFQYQSFLRQKENYGEGHQQKINYQYSGKWDISTQLFIMQNEGERNQTEWFKTLSDVSYTNWLLTPGYRFQLERHSNFRGDSLMNSFMNFNNHQLYLSKQDSSLWSFRISHDFRTDFQVFDYAFQEFERSQTTQLNSGVKYNANSNIQLNFLKRSISVAHKTSLAEDFYQGTIQWSTSLWNGNITQSLFYQTGTGRVLERNYFFQEVPRRMGTHSWSDLNENGIQELNEFFEDETEYGDRNYIKILTMGDNYQTAFINTARYQLQLKMPGAWRKSKGLLKYIGRISSQFQANLESKNLFENWEDRISPFTSGNEAEEILSGKQFLKSNVYYNRGGTASLDLGHTQTNRKQLLMSGFEGNQMEAYHVNGLWNVWNNWNIMTNFRLSSHSSFSEVVAERDFNYSSQIINPQLQWQAAKNWRTILSYESVIKLSPTEAIGGQVLVDQVSISNKYIRENGGIMEGKFGFVKVNSELGNNFTPLAYEMFEGLRAGENFIWNLSVRQKIVGDLNLSIQYGGRKSTETLVIHNGSVQLSALF